VIVGRVFELIKLNNYNILHSKDESYSNHHPYDPYCSRYGHHRHRAQPHPASAAKQGTVNQVHVLHQPRTRNTSQGQRSDHFPI